MIKFLLKVWNIIKYPRRLLLWCFRWLYFPIYHKLIVPNKIKSLRNKELIKVIFVVEELGSWKTENLYLQMLNHPRFSPQLLLLPEVSAHYAYDIVHNYFIEKGYNFSTMKPGERIVNKYHPDIIFYQKPYSGIISHEYYYLENINTIFCYVFYAFMNRCYPGLNKNHFLKTVWQLYADNEICVKELRSVLNNKAKNMIITGIPMMDELLKGKVFYNNPWKEGGVKKCIIYAPHHTIFTDTVKFSSPYDYSTFFQYADFMLEMAKKYKDKVQWAFKPHPLLKMKLYKIWGNDKTDAYYRKWQEMDNCQLSEGEYLGLFKHSDAMIHDCGSFKIEYLYTDNPVMYLIKEDQEFDYPNWQTREALKLHYHAQSKEDIELFIQNVIAGIDPLKEDRKSFVHSYLTPPHGKSACENIINAILGEKEYKE